MMHSLSPFLAGARVLVIENDPLLRASIAKIVSPHVAVVHLAASNAEGLQLWRDEQPDVTLTEIAAPEIDGIALARAIKEEDLDAAIVVFTASGDNAQLLRAIEVDIDGYVFKPLDPALLLNAVARCLRDRRRVTDLKMARMVFEFANEGIIVTDDKLRMLAVNPAFTEITGYRPDEVIGLTTKILSSGLHDPRFYRGLWQRVQTHGRWSGEISNRRKDGTLYSEWLSIAEVGGDHEGAKRYVGLISDITERKKEEDLIRRLAHFDSLTGLPNRTLFNDRLQRATVRAKRLRQTLAVLFIDLDNFKAVNDTYGHAAGDEVLRTMAERIQSTLRQSDTVSRRGGDEFVVILENSEHAEGVASVCEKLVNELKRPLAIGNVQLKLGASIGVATFPNDASNPDELLAAADAALYEAKAAGRGQFNFFHEGAQLKASSRLDMERELRDGLQNWRYTLRYLPEISLVSGELENVEALLRFHHPEFGLLEAGRFLEIAEEIGIMPELGQMALAEAVGELSTLTENYAEPGLVVDLSARQLSAPDAVPHLLNTLVRAGVPTRFITFECSETVLTGNEVGMQTLFSLASSGCRFTLDDFGAGFCSFSLISQLPMTSIKIDCSFIREIDSNPQIRQLVAALIAFCKRLGLRAVAEGVETRSQLEFLRQSHCDSVQGYVFGHPMSCAELKAFVAAGDWRRLLAD